MSAGDKDPTGFKNLMVVDFLNLCFRYKHANKKNFTAEAISTVQSLGRSYEARDIVIANDWGSKHRHDIYPEYKGNRAKMREKQTATEQQAFVEFLEEVIERMKNYKICILLLDLRELRLTT